MVDRTGARRHAPRLADSFETALALSDGVVWPRTRSAERTLSSRRLSGIGDREIEPRLFSFTAAWRSSACDGLGVESFFDPALVVPDERLSLAGGAVMPWTGAQRSLLRPDAAKVGAALHADQRRMAGPAGEGGAMRS